LQNNSASWDVQMGFNSLFKELMLYCSLIHPAGTWMNRGITPLMLTLACPICFTSEYSIWYLSNRKVGGPHSQSGYFGEEFSFVAVENRVMTPWCPACIAVITLSVLPRPVVCCEWQVWCEIGSELPGYPHLLRQYGGQ